CVFFFDRPLVEKHDDQWLALGSGLCLFLECLVKNSGSDDIALDEDRADADAVVHMAGTDNITALEDQATFALAAFHPQNARFSRCMQKLDYVDNRQVIKVSSKRHGADSSQNKKTAGQNIRDISATR